MHDAPTPAGMTIVVTATVCDVEGKGIDFDIDVTDAVDHIARGTHRRYIVDPEALTTRALSEKRAGVGLG